MCHSTIMTATMTSVIMITQVTYSTKPTFLMSFFFFLKGLPIIDHDPDFTRTYSSFVDPSITPPFLLPNLEEKNGNTKTTTKKETQKDEMLDFLLKKVANLEKKIAICDRGNGLPSDLNPTNPKLSWVKSELPIITPDIAKNLALFGKPFV